MKKLATILITFLLIGCSTEETITENNSIMTPTWLQGQWKDVESDRIITITENRISSDGIDVRNAQEDFSTNTTYGVSTEVFRVTVLKTSDKMFFKYFENSEVVVSSYFEKL